VSVNTASWLPVQWAGEYAEDHALAGYTSWRVGGCAEYFYRPQTLADLQQFLTAVPEDLPVTWLGLGSNTLIRDGGIRGLVVLTLNRLAALAQTDEGLLRVEAGVPCAKLAKYCVRQGFEAGAFFAGIPGTVGGALRMNAGAFGGETWSAIEKVEVMDRSGRCQLLPREAFEVGYRQVRGLPVESWFVAAHFRFAAGCGEQARAQIKQLLKKRNDSQPIGTLSCGSVFRNPPGDFSARLIESCGLKGHRIGGAVVSDKHANFILNDADAKAADIEALITYVHDKVLQDTGVDLIRECHILGDP
jgi:UDP-N-acetylmuramate dehydrogenase